MPRKKEDKTPPSTRPPSGARRAKRERKGRPGRADGGASDQKPSGVAPNNFLTAGIGAMDLVSGRNVLIYLQPVAQEKILPLLHYSLRPNGYLVPVGSETITSHRELFEALDREGA